MTRQESKKPRFTHVIKDGKTWLRDREQLKDRDKTELVGPFDSWADAFTYMKQNEQDRGE